MGQIRIWFRMNDKRLKIFVGGLIVGFCLAVTYILSDRPTSLWECLALMLDTPPSSWYQLMSVVITPTSLLDCFALIVIGAVIYSIGVSINMPRKRGPGVIVISTLDPAKVERAKR